MHFVIVLTMSITSLFSTPWRVLKNPQFLYQHHRLIHTFRVTLAFVFGGAIDLAFGIPYGSWTLITIVVLMSNGPTQGDISRKSGQRIIGTIFGALAGLLAVVLYLATPWFGFSWMVFVIGLSAYHALGRASEAAVVTGVTVVIVGGLGETALEESFWRLGNVVIGATIALIFANLLPTRAIDRWRFLFAENLREAALMYHYMGQSKSLEIEPALERVNARMQKMRLLITPAAKECRQSATRFEQLQRNQRILFVILERMYVDVGVKPMGDENRALKSHILRTLMRSARGLRFLRKDLQESAQLRATLDSAEEVDFLTLELSQLICRLINELHLLMPIIVRTQHPLSQLNPAALRYLKK